MSEYQGDIAAAATIYWLFPSTVNGVPTNLAGSPACSVYKNNTTESTSGVTLTAPYDSVTGMNQIKVDTSSDGTFYAAGNNFDVVITTGTLGGTSMVGQSVGSFSIENRSPLRPATAGRTLVVSAGGIADANLAQILADAVAAANLGKTTVAIGRGTVTAGATTTSIPTSAFTPAGAVADQFKNRIILFDAATTTTALRGQVCQITASSNAATPTFTVSALTTAPALGDTFSVI